MTQATKQEFELDVSYPSTCPECRKAGETVSLGFSFKEGGIFCATGKHKFNAVPDDGKAPETAPEPTPAAIQQPAEPEPTPEPAAPVQPVQGRVVVTNTKPSTSGDIEVTLRIPDRHAQAVRAEAEVQKQTLAEYLQFWIEANLDNFWGR
jgi:hypothetical protein